jgi:hypothetical protein
MIAIIGAYFLTFVGTEFWLLADGFDALIPNAIIISLANVMAVFVPARLILPTKGRLRPLWLATLGAIGGLFVTAVWLAVLGQSAFETAFQIDGLAAIGGFGGGSAGLAWWAVETRFAPVNSKSGHV